jgi:hypothetical protein
MPHPEDRPNEQRILGSLPGGYTVRSKGSKMASGKEALGYGHVSHLHWERLGKEAKEPLRDNGKKRHVTAVKVLEQCGHLLLQEALKGAHFHVAARDLTVVRACFQLVCTHIGSR